MRLPPHHTQEPYLDHYVPVRNTSRSLPPFHQLRLPPKSIKAQVLHVRPQSPMDYDHRSQSEDEDEFSLPYDLSTTKRRSPRSYSPRCLQPYLESMKLTHCTNTDGGNGGQSSNGGNGSSQQESSGSGNYMEPSSSNLSFFGISEINKSSLGGGGGGSGGGGDGDDGQNPLGSLPQDAAPLSIGILTPIEPNVCCSPEHVRTLADVNDTSTNFPAPLQFKDHNLKYYLQSQTQGHQQQTQVHQIQPDLQQQHSSPGQTQLTINEPYPQTQQTSFNNQIFRAESPLTVTPPLSSAALSPLSPGLGVTLGNATSDIGPFDSLSQTQVKTLHSYYLMFNMYKNNTIITSDNFK